MDGVSWHCTRGSDQDYPQEKEMQKGKRIVSRGLKNRWEKKRSKRQRRKGSSVQLLSRLQLFATPWLQHTSPPCPSPTPGVYWNSYLSSRRCHPTISSSVIPFSSRLQSFPASGSFPLSQFFASSGKSIGVSASASVLPMNIQDWLSSGLIGLISLQSKGLSRVFSNTTVQKHQLFSIQLSL